MQKLFMFFLFFYLFIFIHEDGRRERHAMCSLLVLMLLILQVAFCHTFCSPSHASTTRPSRQGSADVCAVRA